MPLCEPDPASSESDPVIGEVAYVDIFPVANDRRIYDAGAGAGLLLQKRAIDRLDYYIDLRQMLDEDETIVGASGTVSPVTDPELAILRIVYDPDGVTVWLSGGLDRQRYRVAIIVITSRGKRKKFVFGLLTSETAEPGPTVSLDGDPLPSDGVGEGIGPLMAISPATVAFTPAPVGSTSTPVAVAVSNPGSVRVQLRSITISGPFVFTSNSPGYIDPGEHITVLVRFKPTVIGTRHGRLSLIGNALLSLPLSGRGT